MNSIELEKWMKRIEIKRLYQAPSEALSAVQMAELSQRFLAWSLESEDWRFLNTALKLNDTLRGLSHPDLAVLETLEKKSLAQLRVKCGLS